MRLGGPAETTDVEDNTDVCCKRCWLTFIDVFGEFLVGLGKGDWVRGREPQGGRIGARREKGGPLDAHCPSRGLRRGTGHEVSVLRTMRKRLLVLATLTMASLYLGTFCINPMSGARLRQTGSIMPLHSGRHKANILGC